jgi:hypothetical protein
MSRAILGWAPWATRHLVSYLPQAQLTSFSTFSTNQTSSLPLYRPKLHGPFVYHAEFHSTEQTMASTSVNRERHPPQPTPVSRGHISTLIWIQALILTLTRVADGFVATSWSVTLATLHLISTRFVRGLLNYALGLFPSQLTTRKKGASTGFLFLPLTTENVSLRSYPSRWPGRPG